MMSVKRIEDAINKIIVESRVPKLGIWWLIGDNVYSVEEEFRNIQPSGGIRETDWLHIDTWGKFKRALKISGDYTDYERGRVIYSDENTTFTIICSEQLATNKSAIARIARHFSLPLQNLKIATDFHYTVDPSEADLSNFFDE